MGLFSDVFVVDLIFVSTSLLLLIYYYATKTHDHFKSRGVKYLKPLPFFGNTIDVTLGRKHLSICHKELYEQFDGEDYSGMFMNREPILLIRDPELIQKVLIKDFQHFHDRGTTTDEDLDPLSANLVNLEGQRWKLLRQKLTPAFSSGKLKTMIQQFNECVDGLISYLNETVDVNAPLEIKEAMSKLTTDVIGSCAFGLQFNSLKDPDSKFRKAGRELFLPTFQLRLRLLLRSIHDRLPFLLRIKAIKKESEDFFINLVKGTINYREREKIVRNDFIQILMKLKKEDTETKTSIGNNKIIHKLDANKQQTSENEDNRERQESKPLVLDDKLLAANTFIFFVAGFETTASTLSYCLLELAANDDVQTKLRNEVFTIYNKHNNEISYETIKEMTYMDCVISETLRKYPPVGSLIRKCTIPYKIPGTSTEVKKNERIIIPVYAIHHDPKYYPQPDKFDPERFYEVNKVKRPNGTYLPFGDGPRICIGLRFAQLEMKIALAKLMMEYSVKLNINTQLPLKWKAWRLTLSPESGIWLDLKPIETEKIIYV